MTDACRFLTSNWQPALRLSALTSLRLAPLTALEAAEPVSLSADHAATVNRPRRIFSNMILPPTSSAKEDSARTWMP